MLFFSWLTDWWTHAPKTKTLDKESAMNTSGKKNKKSNPKGIGISDVILVESKYFIFNKKFELKNWLNKTQNIALV